MVDVENSRLSMLCMSVPLMSMCTAFKDVHFEFDEITLTVVFLVNFNSIRNKSFLKTHLQSLLMSRSFHATVLALYFTG